MRMMECDQAAATTRRVLDALGIAFAEWRRLLDVSVALLLEVQRRLVPGGAPGGSNPRAGVGSAGGGFAPVVDGIILLAHPFDPTAPTISRNKLLSVGGNADEYDFFAATGGDREAWRLDRAATRERLRQRFGERAPKIEAAYRKERPQATPSELFFATSSDAFLGVGSDTIAERKVKQGGAPVFRYVFAFRRGGKVMPCVDAEIGATHALDILYKFKNVAGGLGGTRPERLAAASAMSRMRATFAHRPSSVGRRSCLPAYDLEKLPVMYIDAPCRVVYDPFP